MKTFLFVLTIALCQHSLALEGLAEDAPDTLEATVTQEAPAAKVEQPIVLEPGQTAKIVTRKTVTITKKTESAPLKDSNRPSWRCKNIPDEAFLHLGTYTKGAAGKSAWERRAGEFITAQAENCPGFAALEKELPPYLNSERYTKPLGALFELNKLASFERLMSVAREDELERAQNRKPALKIEDYKKLQLRAGLAKIFLDVKFAEEVKSRNESFRFVNRFGRDFLDKSGNPKTKNFVALREMLKALTPAQKTNLKFYLKDVLAKREYPKSGLLDSKNERSPAAISKKEAGNRAVIQLLMFEVE